MTVVQWADGNVLTAGSLRLIPQLYSYKPYSAQVALTSGASYLDIGSMFISGALFSESLIVDTSINVISNGVSSAHVETFRLFLSGPGLGGGSEVWLSPTHNIIPLSQPINHVITSGAGWIPGSACFLYVQGRTSLGNPNSNINGLAVYGTGKP